ncbi:MAG: histidine ammonia-lyase [Flavobacteriales bacterium]|nr:histidine ammonia-lyase [Flavobacteriales bacterium]
MSKTFSFGTDRLTVALALDLAAGRVTGTLSSRVVDQVRKSRQAVDDIVKGSDILYGVNTGFGPLCQTRISPEDTEQLQVNLIKSHSVGVGEAVSPLLSRLMLITKLQALTLGFSGVSVELLERILWHIDNNVIPVVPSQGSVGASGDLAPLAHLFLPLIGLGEVTQSGARRPAAEVLAEAGLQPLALKAKEGLALINGTQFIASHAILAVERLHHALNTADVIGAMSLEALLGSTRPFDERLHQLRPFNGNLLVAHRLRELLKGSEMVVSHEHCERVQDPYSLRCMPPVHGASRNAWLHLKELTHIEINSVTDNPIVLDAQNTISGGNFHGQPLALPLDYATLAAHEVGNISDRRTYLLLEGREGLPKLLMRNTGINSGFMIPQYTSAALVSENKALCFPASADSIPTSLGQEDHVSMGSISGRKLNQVIDNLEKVLAVELICAAQAFDYRRPLKSGLILERCHDMVRSFISHTEEDRVFSDDLQTATQIISQYKLSTLAAETAAEAGIDLNGEHDALYRLS